MFRAARVPAALLIALACLPALGLQRAFVSSAGTDANAASGCSLGLPCRTFQAAHGAVDAGGEIVALDTAGYAPVVVSKSVSISGAPGVVAGISVASGTGVVINTPGVKVTLRNLSINSVGGTRGIEMSDGTSLTIDNCSISNFPDSGVIFYPSTTARLRMVDSVVDGNWYGVFIGGNAMTDIAGSRISGNNFHGVYVEQASGGIARTNISDTVLSGNSNGVFNRAYNGEARLTLIRVTAFSNNAAIVNRAETFAGIARLTVGSSMASGNALGFQNSAIDGATAVFESLGNNIVRQNDFNSDGTITPVSGL